MKRPAWQVQWAIQNCRAPPEARAACPCLKHRWHKMIFSEGSDIIVERGLKGDRISPWQMQDRRRGTSSSYPFILLWLVPPHYLPFREAKILTQPRRSPSLLRMLLMRQDPELSQLGSSILGRVNSVRGSEQMPCGKTNGSQVSGSLLMGLSWNSPVRRQP